MYRGNQGEIDFGSNQREVRTIGSQPYRHNHSVLLLLLVQRYVGGAETICMTCKVQIQTVYHRITLNVTVKFYATGKFQALRFFRGYNLQTSGVVAWFGSWNLPEANGSDRMILFCLLLLLLLRLLLSGFKKLRRGLVYLPKIKSSHTTAFQDAVN